jgi:hypothetical protein
LKGVHVDYPPTVDTLVIGADLAMRQAKHSNAGYAFAR